MKRCPNESCRFRTRHKTFAEYQDAVDVCSECGSDLVFLEPTIVRVGRERTSNFAVVVTVVAVGVLVLAWLATDQANSGSERNGIVAQLSASSREPASTDRSAGPTLEQLYVMHSMNAAVIERCERFMKLGASMASGEVRRRVDESLMLLHTAAGAANLAFEGTMKLPQPVTDERLKTLKDFVDLEIEQTTKICDLPVRNRDIGK